MYKYEQSFWDTFRDKHGVLESSKWFYGCEYSDNFLFNDPKSLPRFGHLARKTLMHYLGDHYNPHKDATLHEPFIRGLIQGFIEYKIEHKTIGHDWEFIDNFLRKVIGNLYGVPIPYDQRRIELGILPPYRGKDHPMDIQAIGSA